MVNGEGRGTVQRMVLDRSPSLLFVSLALASASFDHPNWSVHSVEPIAIRKRHQYNRM